jgi:hypothetical protein
MRTRSGRGSKPAAKADKPEITSPKATTKINAITPLTRKATRSSANHPNYAHLDSAVDVYASYEKPLFMVFGLSSEFFDSLEEREIPEEEESSSSSSEESDVPVLSQPAPRGRGRGGRGSRGGRGRGGRGRGRGRGRGGLARVPSPVRTRPSRNAAPMFPLTEADDEEPSNQNSPMPDAKKSPEPEEEASTTDEQPEVEEDERSETDSMELVQAESSKTTTPPGLPATELVQAYNDPSIKIPVPIVVPKVLKPRDSASNTRLEGASTPAERAVPKLLSPDDDVLSDSDLPEPWLDDQPSPIEAECDDRADYLLKSRFKPMTDVGAIIASLTKFAPAQRSTETLYALAQNTQRILRAWQDEFLMLDARVSL